MKTSTKLLSMFSAFCAILFLGMTANAQSISVVPGLTATQMAQALVGSNVTVTNATYVGASNASGSFSQSSSTFPLADGIVLTSGNAINALGPNNSTGMSASNNTPGDLTLNGLTGGIPTYDAAVLEFDITSNCNTVTFDYIFASEEYPEYACSNFNDAFGFFISGPGFAPNTNIALVPGTTTPVSINNVINSPGTNCVSNPSYYVDNAAGLSIQYDGYTVTMTATASIQPCQTYHIKIAVADAGDSALDSAVFLKGGGINCTAPSLATTANITGVECGALGSIDLSVNSGTGPFTYTWTGPNGFTATTEDLTGLAAGDYTVDIVGSDCLSSGQATFNVPNNPDVTAPVFSNCPADITVQATNTSCSEAVNITPPTVTDNCPNVTVTSSYTPGDLFSVGTTPVTYTATDASGNTSTCTFNVTVDAQPLSLTLAPYVWNGGWNIRCYGQNSGRITAVATGGCGPYTYSWSAGIPVAGGTISVGLYAGSCTLTVTDANGNSVTESAVLTQPAPFVSTTTWTPIPCYGGTSSVTTSGTGGTMPYNGINTTTVYAGTYQYILADANGCRAYDTLVIDQPDILDITAMPDPILCFGDSTIVNVNGTGGTMPYTGAGAFGAVAGIYDYTIVDANGCTESTTLAINQPAQLTAMVSNTPILCNGGLSQVTVTVASGTEPYTGTGIFYETAGTYTYTVFDYNLCEDEVTVTITEPTPMVSTLSATPILCNGGTTTITATGTGGTGVWTGTGTFTETAGTYDYVFTDANGCTDTNSITVTEPTLLVASASATSVLCNGGTADVTVTATGGTPGYTGTGTFTVSAGTHDFVVTDANGCSTTVTVTVTEPTALVASASATPIDCNGGSSDITVTATGGTGSYTGTGLFTVTAGTHDFVVTDGNGCSTTVTVTVTEPAVLSATATATPYSCVTGLATVTVSATGGTPSYIGVGSFSEGLGTHTYNITDANGCTTTASVTVSEIPASITIVGAPSDATVECDAVPTAPTVTAVGTNGENINVTYTENILGSGCSYQIVRTWTAIDSCGNQMVSTQTLNVQDTQGPVFACPADYTIDCNNPFIPIDSVVITTTDCSNNVTVSITDSIVTGTAFVSSTTIYRTITAADDCGNVTSCTQVISGTPVLTEGECKKCDTEISIVVDPFNPSCVYVHSLCKDLSNVVLGDINGWEYKFDGLSGYTGYFCHPSGLPITDVWVKAGCYRSGDGPGYGHHFDLCGSGGPVGPPTYEPSAGLNTSYEWIQQVSLGSINNISGNNGGYGDFSTMATAPSLGDVVSLQLTPGFTGVSYDEYWRVWVDWNNDGDFVDAGEQVYQNNGTGVLNGSFTVPQTSLTDTDLKVRVAMKWDAYSAPNEMFQYGEVEDYTIYVQAGGIDGMQTTIGSVDGDKGFKQGNGTTNDVKSNEVFENEANSGYGIELGDVYPNPVLSANGKFNLDIRTNTTDVTIRIVDLSGRVVLSEEMFLGVGANKCQLDVTGFTRGSYLIEVLSGESKETTQLIVQ